MKKISILIFLTFIFVSITLSCEKDDICAEATPTTPKLILRFYDASSQDDTKNVSDLGITSLDENNDVFVLSGINGVTTDSINLPLRTDVNLTKFVFHKDYNSADATLGNPDIVTITYEREDVYVSRACGFKTIFNNITISVELDSDNWIIDSDIINSTVENEISAHVKILH